MTANGDSLARNWRCPEDHIVVSGFDESAAIAAVQDHFRLFDHEQIKLAGFTDGGPMIAGWVDE